MTIYLNQTKRHHKSSPVIFNHDFFCILNFLWRLKSCPFLGMCYDTFNFVILRFLWTYFFRIIFLDDVFVTGLLRSSAGINIKSLGKIFFRKCENFQHLKSCITNISVTNKTFCGGFLFVKWLLFQPNSYTKGFCSQNFCAIFAEGCANFAFVALHFCAKNCTLRNHSQTCFCVILFCAIFLKKNLLLNKGVNCVN